MRVFCAITCIVTCDAVFNVLCRANIIAGICALENIDPMLHAPALRLASLAQDHSTRPVRWHENINMACHEQGPVVVETTGPRRMVGAGGFEPPTSASRTQRSIQAEPRPDMQVSGRKTFYIRSGRDVSNALSETLIVILCCGGNLLWRRKLCRLTSLPPSDIPSACQGILAVCSDRTTGKRSPDA